MANKQSIAVIFLAILAVFVDIALGRETSATTPGEIDITSKSHTVPAYAEGPSDGQKKIPKTRLRKIVVTPRSNINDKTSGVIIKTTLSITTPPPPEDLVSADITTTTQGSTPPTENDLQGTDKTSAATVTSLPSTTTTYTEGVSNGISTKVKKIKKIIVPRGNFHGVSYGIATKEKQLKKIIVPRGNFHGVSYRIPTKEKQLKKIIVPRGNFHERKINAGLGYPKKRVETPYPEGKDPFLIHLYFMLLCCGLFCTCFIYNKLMWVFLPFSGDRL
ncbi:uncharacterized protein LOC142741778 [Rhinoderma darwinii]|uniref:uncharacterized protein LOC142741778 n=1 Tax=Rhinoderma darwinii TaxID=43563 RepID=UPI003F66225D